MIFPGRQVDGLQTINQARGRHPLIADRFDLTFECIRRHHLGEDSPLRDVLNRYTDYFEFFGSFPQFVGHFLLQDLVAQDGTVRFFLPGGFQRPALPEDIGEYDMFRETSIYFVRSRNNRIDHLRVPIKT